MRHCILDECNRKHKAHGYCSVHYQRLVRLGSTDIKSVNHKKAIDYCISILKTDSPECINWPFRAVGGYGIFHYHGKDIKATRFILTMKYGANPELSALHKPIVCHNSLCVNPNHLRWGTAKDNANDMLMDNTRRYISSLSSDEISYIRDLSNSGVYVAKKLGISASHVSRIRNGSRCSSL